MRLSSLYAISAILILSLATFSSGCSGGQEAKTDQKGENSQDTNLLGATPDPKVGEKRAQREADFKKEMHDPGKSPILDPSASEKAPAEFGFGVKTEAQIAQELPRENKIGVLAPLVGDVKVFGQDTSDGAEMASDEINSHGGIRGKQYDLLVYDTKSSIAGARAGVENLARQGVAGIVGAPTGEVSFSASKLINDDQLILLSAGSRRRLGDTGPYYFRNTLNDKHGIKRLMEYVINERKLKKFALFTSLINDYSIKLSAAFKAEIENNKGELTHELYIISSAMSNVDQDETSIPAQLKKLKGNLPDAIIYTGDGMEGAQVLKEMRKMGLKIPMVGGEDLMVPEFTSMGAAANGTLVYGGFNEDSENPRVKTFVTDFKKRFNHSPSRVAALSYDAYYMLAQAIGNAKSMRPSHLRNALAEIKDFKGVTGNITMDKEREAIKEPFIFEMKNKDNQYRFVAMKEPL